MFVDRVTVELQAGKGGNGIVAWHRSKYIPKGGPAGGIGGHGGSIYFEADTQIPSLEWFRYRRKINAENGVQGGPNCRTGRRGKDLILKVPCGTLIKDADTQEVLCDLTEDKQRWLMCERGRGGRGNDSFKSSTNRAPNYATPGKLGQARRIELELKLIADVGLIGFPNAGKSTLITKLAGMMVKIAPYPFTTLHPNLGFFECREEHRRIFIADIPGIIEDAHQNRGLGLQFLRHIERTRLLVYVLDASGIDGRTPLDDLRVLRQELEKYNPELLDRPYLVALNKVDTEESEEHKIHFYGENPEGTDQLFEISALLEEGLDILKHAIIKNTKFE